MSSWRMVSWVGLCGILVCVSTTARASEPSVQLTPARVVEMAVSSNPTLKMALITLRQKLLAVEGEEHRYRPTFISEVGYTHTSNPSLKSGGVEVGVSDGLALTAGVEHLFAFGMAVSAELRLGGTGTRCMAPVLDQPLALGIGYGLNLRLAASQPLLPGLGWEVGEAALRIARAQRGSATHARDREASVVVRDVLTAYWEFWYAQALVAIQRNGLVVTKRVLADAEERVKEGALAKLELLLIKTELAQVTEELLAAEADAQRLGVALARLVGHPIEGAERLACSQAAPKIPDAIPSPQRVAAQAKDSAYELAEMEADVEAAEIRASVAADPVRPKLDAEVWMTISGLGQDDAGAAFEMFGTFQAVSAFVGLRLELPTDTTRLRSEAAQALLASDTAKERLRDRTDRLVEETVAVQTRLRGARDRLKLAKETSRLAALSVEGQKARFQAGGGTATEWVVTQQKHREAEQRVARARVDLAVSRLALLHLTGGLLAEVATSDAVRDVTRPGGP